MGLIPLVFIIFVVDVLYSLFSGACVGAHVALRFFSKPPGQEGPRGAGRLLWAFSVLPTYRGAVLPISAEETARPADQSAISRHLYTHTHKVPRDLERKKGKQLQQGRWVYSHLPRAAVSDECTAPAVSTLTRLRRGPLVGVRTAAFCSDGSRKQPAKASVGPSGRAVGPGKCCARHIPDQIIEARDCRSLLLLIQPAGVVSFPPQPPRPCSKGGAAAFPSLFYAIHMLRCYPYRGGGKRRSGTFPNKVPASASLPDVLVGI